jgi:hypothetical protein
MKTARKSAWLAGLIVALVTAGPAHADPDTDFANQLHDYGIYGQKDYNAWIGKITCKRLSNRVDTDAGQSVQFIARNLPKASTTSQAWQFFAAAVNTYCPDNVSRSATSSGPPQ